MLRQHRTDPVGPAPRTAPGSAMMTGPSLVDVTPTAPVTAARAGMAVPKAHSQRPPAANTGPACHAQRHLPGCSWRVEAGIIAADSAQAPQTTARDQRTTNRRAILHP